MEVKPLILTMEIWLGKRMKVMEFKEFKKIIIDEIKWRIENEVVDKDVVHEYEEFMKELETVEKYEDVIGLLEKYGILGYFPSEFVNIYKHMNDLYEEGRINDAKLLNRCVKPIYLGIPWAYTMVCELMPKYIVVDERVSSGYYSYVLKLIDTEIKEEIDAEIYGDLSYWGYANESRTYDEALNDLLNRNNLKREDVVVYSCGGYYQQDCEEVM